MGFNDLMEMVRRGLDGESVRSDRLARIEFSPSLCSHGAKPIPVLQVATRIRHSSSA